MPRPLKIKKYNPALSVEENARKNGVAISTMRSYIAKHHIDRRREHKLNIIAICKAWLEEHPNASKKAVSEGTKISLSTVRRYWDNITNGKDVDFNKNKISKKKQSEKQERKKQLEVLKGIPIEVIREYLEQNTK